MDTRKQTCPRRMGTWGPWERVENLDGWREDGTCTFCGSLNPVEFLEQLERNEVVLTPTDKNYKVYVDHKEDSSRFNKFYFQHLSNEQQLKFIELYNVQPPLFEIKGGDFYVMPFFARKLEVTHDN